MPREPKTAEDRFAVGVIWSGGVTDTKGGRLDQTADFLIVITERSGKDFRGIYRWSMGPRDKPDAVGFSDIAGTASGDSIAWKDAGHSCTGKLVGEKLSFRRVGISGTPAEGSEGEGTLGKPK